MSTNAKMLVKFGPVVAEIFDKLCRFLPSRPKSYTETPCEIYGVSGSIAIKLAQNVAKILPFNTYKSEL